MTQRCPLTSVTLATIASSEAPVEIQGTLESLTDFGEHLLTSSICVQVQVVLLCARERADLDDVCRYESVDVRILQPADWQSMAGEMGTFPASFELLNAMLPHLFGEAILLAKCGYRARHEYFHELSEGVVVLGVEKGVLAIPRPSRHEPLPKLCILSRTAMQEYGVLMFAADGWAVDVKFPWIGNPKYTRVGGPRSIASDVATFEWVLGAIAAYYQEDKPRRGLKIKYLKELCLDAD